MNADVPVDWGAAPEPEPQRPSWIMLEPVASAPPPDAPTFAAPEVVAAEPESSPPEIAPEAASLPPPSSEGPIEVGAPPAPEVSEECEALRAALVHAITAGVKARRYALAAAERDLIQLATAIARQIVAREIATAPALVAAWAREGLTALGQQDQVVVAVAPDVADLMPADAWRSALDGLAPLVVDRSLPPQGCEVRGRYGRVDAGVEARLATVIEALVGARDLAAEAEAA